MKIKSLLALAAATLSFLFPALSYAEDATVNAEARVFNPAIVYVQPGDTVHWQNMTSHNSVAYLTPDGVEGWGEHGKLPGSSLAVKMDKPGIFGYACEPHVGFGMVGVVVVGDVTADDIAAAKQKAMDTLQGPFKRIIGKVNKVQPTK